MTSRPLPDLAAVTSAFRIDGHFLDGAHHGNGHINDTYAVRFAKDGSPFRVILQRVNHHIFKNVPALMDNIRRVTEHIRAKLATLPGHAPARETLTLIPTVDGGIFYQDGEGNFWRAYIFLEGLHVVEVVEHATQAREAGRAFADFQKWLADLPAPKLFETIPDFHHTPRRFAALEAAIAADSHNRAAQVKHEIAFALARQTMASTLVKLLATGELPERITHNDTKINNVMLEDGTDHGTAVIDLDTVMPGLVHYDFGDQIRTSTCTGTEDERELKKVAFRIGLFEGLARGYLEGAREFLTPCEIDCLAFSGPLITFEIGIRFLTDFLQGDLYFKTHRTGQNLDRCRTQFARARAMEAARSQMEAVIARYR